VPHSHISPAMSAAVGSLICTTRSHPITDSDIRRWAIAVYWPHDPPPRFIAGSTGPQRLSAPEELNPFAWSVAEQTWTHPAEPGPDSTENRVGIPGPGLRRILNGGLRVEYGRPMRSGDVITAVRRLGPYSERAGRLGPMLLSTTEEDWTNQDGEPVRSSTMTLIRY